MLCAGAVLRRLPAVLGEQAPAPWRGISLLPFLHLTFEKPGRKRPAVSRRVQRFRSAGDKSATSSTKKNCTSPMKQRFSPVASPLPVESSYLHW